ncbi:hypothetical protein [Moheibacter lacus]|uniref:Uncharacterized protein n=1 Tax=Moheibacter lacus TaxID=2745851 RepID=A0A838ZMT0_9FLAO|nr:hypothetical protein [Moheibacter lacus]MBA5628916.1 hypothetical protein [Moheibacter lacus]
MKTKFIVKYFPYFLFLYHLGFAWVAYDYVNQNNGDAVKYWFVGSNMENLEWISFLKPGTEFIQFITFPFVKFLHLPGWAGCLLFSAFSGIGFLKLWKLAKEISFHKSNFLFFFMLFLLLPNTHFWTSLIGKEAILFWPVVHICSQLYKKEFFTWSVWISFFMIAWIRPHFAFVVFLAYLIAIIWKGRTSIRIKFLLGISGILLSIALYFLLAEITNAQIPLIQKIENLYAAHNFKLKGTAAYVPMEEYIYPYKMFTFYFRPILFERPGMLYQLIGLENLILLGFFIGILYGTIRYWKKLKCSVFQLFAVLLLILYGTMLVYGYANFGLIIRSKSLVFPVILMLGISVLQEFRCHCDSKFSFRA